MDSRSLAPLLIRCARLKQHFLFVLVATVLAACSGGRGGDDSPNQPPTASFTADPSSGDAPLTIAFDASASTDPDGAITRYDWAFGDGGTATGVTTSHSYAAAGTFTMTLTVHDDDGAVSTTTRSVVISGGGGSPNQLPTASFTADPASGDAPLTVAFDATESTDPDGSITQYDWSFGDGGSAAGATTSHEYSEAGTFTVTLTVRDDDGATSAATQSIAVSEGSPGGGSAIPVANADSAVVQEDGLVAIAVLANDSAAGGDTLQISGWTAPLHGTVTAGQAGDLVYAPQQDFWGSDGFQYTITDSQGGQATAVVSISVTSSPDAPVARDDSAVTATSTPVQILPLANDSDADGDVLSISSFTQAVNGTVTSMSSGTLTYAPRTGFTGSDAFSYVVSDGTGRQDVATVTIDVRTQSGDGFLQTLSAAPEGSWIRVNRNHFSDVWTPLEQRPSALGFTSPAKIILAWSSMAWDSNRRQLIFWGGGHANYSGNDVYRFDVMSGLWERASLPSQVHAPLGDSQYFAVDGPFAAPIAAHTYDNQEFLPIIDRFITFGGGKFNCCSEFVLYDGVTPTGPYLWDPSRAAPDMVGGTTGSQVNPELHPDVIGAEMWQNRNAVAVNGTGAPRPTNFVNGTTAYAGDGTHDIVLVTEIPREGGKLFRYTINSVDEPALDTWELVGVRGKASYSDQGAGAFDPVRKIYARTADSSAGRVIAAWSLVSPGPTNTSVNVTLDGTAAGLDLTTMHGMDFDTVRQVFVLWDGGPDVWYVRPPDNFGAAGWQVSRARTDAGADAPDRDSGSYISPAGSVTTSRGILGKWKYAREYDVFLGVEDPVNGDVWAYKPEGWRPPSP